ncbi:MAG: hypothetical protein MZU91_13020 [Desulfosudis oleivorans]|nr:hypothetical protein [Desulfosudis oleivorans]
MLDAIHQGVAGSTLKLDAGSLPRCPDRAVFRPLPPAPNALLDACDDAELLANGQGHRNAVRPQF